MSQFNEDPLVRSARREALAALILWLVAMVYTIGYCYLNGYGRSPESLTFVLWFPDWVFWGIIVPWGLCALGSLPFAFRIMGDEPLGDDTTNELDAGTVHDAQREGGSHA